MNFKPLARGNEFFSEQLVESSEFLICDLFFFSLAFSFFYDYEIGLVR